MSDSNDRTQGNPRAIRGHQIADRFRVRQSGDHWIVPSQSGDGRYSVFPDEERCTCPDHEQRQVKCKHLYAVEFTIQRETDDAGNVRVTETARVTYAREWSSYNIAQTEEGGRFRALLADLCSTIPQPEQSRGRPRLPLSEMALACVLKVYTGFSSRRFVSSLREAQTDGLISRVPHFNSVNNYMSDAAMTDAFKNMITLSALPLRGVEQDIAVDSSGFATSQFVRWYAKQHERVLDNHRWVKAHIAVGVVTGVVTAVEITDWTANDNPYLAPLVEDTARHFAIRDVTADKQYIGRKNAAAVEQVGATPYIPFKVNSVVHAKDAGTAWERMYHRFALERKSFLEHYHQRSNVESTFGAIKAKFGSAVRSRGEIGQTNEVLCKVLAHNITVLIHAMETLGIEPEFGCTEEMDTEQVFAANR